MGTWLRGIYPCSTDRVISALARPEWLVDLRMDWDETDPVKPLHALWQAYQGEMESYVLRALDPSAAPSYGVPGDE